ncbi:unnamed protein product, partial [Rotaria sp. Silwood1]
MTSRFQGGMLNKVRWLTMNDTRPFENKLFKIISQDFPFLETGQFTIGSYHYCRAAGGHDCGLFAAICTAAKLFLDNNIGTVIPWRWIIPPFDNWCLGQPLLKCCVTGPDEQCHSAFNTEAPINCEAGAGVGYPLPVWTAGLCVRSCNKPGDPCMLGCTCNYLATCRIPRPPQQLKTLRMPFTTPAYRLETDDWFITARQASFLQGLTTLIERQAYLSQINNQAELILRSYLSPFVLDLFKEAFPKDWQLFAVPVGNETSSDWLLSNAQNPVIDGCELALPTKAQFTVSDEHGYVEGRLTVFLAASQWIVVRLDWGDSILSDSLFTQYQSSIFRHSYIYPGKYMIQVSLMNSAGLFTHIRKTVHVSSGYTSNIVHVPACVTKLHLTVTVQGKNYPSDAGTLIMAIQGAATDDYSTIGAVNLTTISENSGAYSSVTYKTYTIDLPWAAVTPLRKLKFTCRAYDNYLYTRGTVLFENIALEIFSSENQPTKDRVIITAENMDMAYVLPEQQRGKRDEQGRWILPCARRGDVFEDDETVAVITMKNSNVLISSQEPAHVQNDADEVLLEYRPNEFTSADLPTIPTTPTIS